MARRKSLKLPPRKVIFIFSDGETEQNYFKLKYRQITEENGGKERQIVKVVNRLRDEQQPRNYVKYITDYLHKNYGSEKPERVFCVFDLDVLNKEDVQASIKKKPKYIEFIPSNPNFEIWLLLHYRYYHHTFGNHEPFEKLRECEGNYEKPHVEPIFKNLIDLEENAIENVNRLRNFKNCDPDTVSKDINPFTNVDLVVEALNDFNKIT